MMRKELILLFAVMLEKLMEVQGCATGDLRPVKGAVPDDGRDYLQYYLQYCYSGEWRRLCTRNWSEGSARVACGQLGYGGFIARGNNCPEPGTRGTAALSALCTGTESRIQDCGDGIMEDDCDCLAQAWLACLRVCADGDVRLVGNSTNRGRVEVCTDGRWGIVCNNNPQLAAAVCSKLGFLSEEVTTIPLAVSAALNLPITNCAVENGGSLNCSLITDASCNHSMDLGVVCRTYEQLYNELLDQRSSTDSPTPCPTTEVPPCPTCPTCEVPPYPTCPPSEVPMCPTTDCPTSLTATTLSCDCTTPPQTLSCNQTKETSIDTADRTGDTEIQVTNRDITIYGAAIGLLAAVIIAMVIGWLCTCIIMKRRSTVVMAKNGFVDDGHSGSMHRELFNPAYDGTFTPQPRAKTQPTSLPTYEEADLPSVDMASYDDVVVRSTVSSDNTIPAPNAHDVTYDVADIPVGATYSVVNKRGGTEPNQEEEYNVLVHNGFPSNQPIIPNIPEEEYSKLQI